MDRVIELLTEARNAGLVVSVNCEKLVIRGPSSAGHIAEKLISNKPAVMEVLQFTLPSSDPHSDFDTSAVFGPTPQYVQHRRRDCHSVDWWEHRWGGFYCCDCFACTDPIMKITSNNQPGRQPIRHEKVEWTSGESDLFHWFSQHYDDLLDSAEDIQHQIDFAGIMLILKRGRNARGAKQALADLRLLKADPAAFHQILHDRHIEELKRWKPHFGKGNSQ